MGSEGHTQALTLAKCKHINNTKLPPQLPSSNLRMNCKQEGKLCLRAGPAHRRMTLGVGV